MPAIAPWTIPLDAASGGLLAPLRFGVVGPVDGVGTS